MPYPFGHLAPNLELPRSADEGRPGVCFDAEDIYVLVWGRI
jgi:hypothetical protein